MLFKQFPCFSIIHTQMFVNSCNNVICLFLFVSICFYLYFFVSVFVLIIRTNKVFSRARENWKYFSFDWSKKCDFSLCSFVVHFDAFMERINFVEISYFLIEITLQNFLDFFFWYYRMNFFAQFNTIKFHGKSLAKENIFHICR